ncbi:NAD-dependent protein deacylase [Amphibacillus indicireducens]|uniref:protein acetyllysine N-acetyltransferase n=1 Tax=Amphibacillus indicireducens TaxID=1076330 RepID=A0ABP7V8R8_9BACI
MKQINQLAKLISEAKSIVFLTGAGVSTASGIPDFRSTDGIWTEDRSREYYTSVDYYTKDPYDFWRKYKEIFQIKLLRNFQPNEVHNFIAELETQGKDISIVTQNVDSLHSLAGNKHVVEYHGNLNTATCPVCGAHYDLAYLMEHDVPVCTTTDCKTVVRPDIVLFGDPITKHSEAEMAIASSDLMLVLGTSLLVTPFSLLPSSAKQYGIPMAIVNRDPTPMDDLFDHVIHADLVAVVEQLKQLI